MKHHKIAKILNRYITSYISTYSSIHRDVYPSMHIVLEDTAQKGGLNLL